MGSSILSPSNQETLSMSKFSKNYCASTLSILLGTTSAFADVTNADVWGNWQSYLETMGYSVTANEAASGGVLLVTDLEMKMVLEDSDEDISMTMPSLTLTEQGDGSVKIAMPPLSQVAFKMALQTGEEIDAVIGYAQDGLDMVATGENGNFEYTYSANTMNLTLEKLTVDGAEIGSSMAKGTIGFEGIVGRSAITGSELRNMAQVLNATAMTYDMMFSDPDSDGSAKINGSLQNLTSNVTSMFPIAGVNMQDMGAMLASGFSTSGTFTYQGGNMDMAFVSPDGAGTVNTSSTGGAMEYAFGADGLNYDVSQTGLAINALVPDVPLPIVLNMALAKFNFAMPVQKSDEEQDFAFGFTMGDFTVSDMLWGMLDPSAQLSRDPATIALNLTGKAKVLFDFMNPDQAAALESSGAAPGELNALTLKNLVVDAVGARLTGTGDFTFDNSDLASFDGMPRPTGAVDLKLVGGNGLLDKLVEMGMLPQEQAMGARMMMGLFAVASAEPDTLNSKLEINDEGHILANGQRIQ
jgi:hypothetical protein